MEEKIKELKSLLAEMPLSDEQRDEIVGIVYQCSTAAIKELGAETIRRVNDREFYP